MKKKMGITISEGAMHVDMSNGNRRCAFTNNISLFSEGMTREGGYSRRKLSAGQMSRRESCPMRVCQDGLGRLPSRRAKAAFTLAEVLITLAIIGVVAAMTIPSLVTKINSKAAEHQKEVMLSRLAEGLNMYSNSENGLNREYNNTEEFVRGLSKHMKMIQICGTSNMADCFPFDKIYYDNYGELKSVDVSSLTTAKSLKLKAEGYLDPAGFIMANGTPVIMSWNNNCGSMADDAGKALVDPDKALSWNNLPLGSCIDGLYDLKAKNNKAIYAKDVQPFGSAKIGKSCLLEADNKCLVSTAPVVPTPLTVSDCNANKSKYGITNCRTADDDYWGGAMKMCADQDMHLPTEAELTQLATYLYNTNVSSTGTTNGTLDTSKLPDSFSGLGSSWSHLWSSAEANSNGAYGRGFGRATTNRTYDYRYYSSIRAFCVED